MEEIVCIKCCEAGNQNGNGNLLVCRENGCPMAIHEGCLSGCPARLDDAGRFCCPYCWYKRTVAEWRSAREHALVKKKALMIFLGEEAVGSGKCLEENRIGEGRKDCGRGRGGGNRAIRIDEEGGGEEVGRDSAQRGVRRDNEICTTLRRSKRFSRGSGSRLNPEAALRED